MNAVVWLVAQNAAPGGVPAPAPLANTNVLALVALASVLTLAPFVLLVGTSFVKVSIVLGMVRNAIGLPDVPSAMVITGLATILTLHIMAPTATAVVAAAGPALEGALAADVTRPEGVRALAAAWRAGRPPIQRFLRANASAADRALFLDLARRNRPRPDGAAPALTPAPAPAAPDDLAVLLPAFLVSELTSAFAIGFLLFLPFVIVDLVIASVLAALGMQGVSSGTIALPFKLLLFVLSGGWYLLARALVLGYR